MLLLKPLDETFINLRTLDTDEPDSR